MALFEFALVWLPVVFGVLVAASYVGTTLALRSYFDDGDYTASDVIRIGDGSR